MAAGLSSRTADSPSRPPGSSSHSPRATQSTMDRLQILYPHVNEDETPLPRSWSPKDKYNFIGLSQNNLRVHYKGKKNDDSSLLCQCHSWYSPLALFLVRFYVYFYIDIDLFEGVTLVKLIAIYSQFIGQSFKSYVWQASGSEGPDFLGS